jgi:hypothetical protein
LSFYVGVVTSALISAFFLGVYLKTGIDASPSGLVKQILEMLQPYMVSNLNTPIEYLKLLLVISPWIGAAISILKAPNKIAGLILYVVVFASVVIMITTNLVSYLYGKNLL